MHEYDLPVPRPAAVNDAASTARPGSLALIIGRIEEAVEAETRGLKTERDFDLSSSNARKSRYLYELTRATKGMAETTLLAEHRDSLVRLRGTLARNEAAIRAHLEAVNEVASLMRDAIRRAEADGTYSAAEFGWVA